MTIRLPAPLTPPECDLRGMPYMPLDIVRLFDSDLYALSTGDEFKAAVTLWGKAFLQLPGGSLPNDDRVLAHLSGAGANWSTVREVALRGWFKASDGRLYHPTVAEKANSAWEARVARKARTEAARAARANNRKELEVAPTVTDTPGQTVTTSVTENVTGSKGEGKGRESKESKKEEERTLTTFGAQQPAPVVPINVRAELFREGVDVVRKLTGRADGAVRTFIGKMLKIAGDDAAVVLAIIREAESLKPADPTAWLSAAAKSRDPKRMSTQDKIARDWNLPGVEMLDDHSNAAWLSEQVPGLLQ